MSWESYQPQTIDRLGSLVTNFAQEKLANGLSPNLRNVRFGMNSVATRYGIQKGISTGNSGRITGLLSLVRTGQSPQYIPLLFDSDGVLYQESPVGGGAAGGISGLVTPPSGAYMEGARAFQRAYLTFGDLKTGTGEPGVYDATNFDPLSVRPMGEAWAASTAYRIGDVISPTTPNAHLYRCTTPGTSGTLEPLWNTGTGSTTSDQTCVWTESIPTYASSAAAGNICTGTRYALVLYVNRNGEIGGATSAAIITITIAAGSKKIDAGAIPIGPANTAQRIIAFTVAGGAMGGPYFFIPASETSGGVAETATVINDNTTTTATFNFNDDYLKLAVDVTDNFRKIKLPPQAHIIYNGTSRRMFTFGEANQPSLMRVSEADQPETFYGDTGFCYVSRDDGERLITAREFRNSTYAYKERSCFTVSVAADADPIDWNITPRWQNKIGPTGPRAVDAGVEFMAFASRAGGYIYDGSDSPTWITPEIQDQWEQINWAYGHLISVHIDDEQKEIRFAVPFGKSTLPNKIFTCNFARGTDEPIHFSSFSGKEVALPSARKWSIDDIACSQIIRMERPLTSSNPNDPISSELAQSQIMLASSGQDGTCNVITPDTYADNGVGINSYYDTASLGQGDNVVQFGGVSISAIGQGKLLLQLVPFHGDAKPLRTIEALSPLTKGYFRRQGRGTGRQFGIRFSNGGVAGAWFEVFEANIYLKPLWPSEVKG